MVMYGSIPCCTKRLHNSVHVISPPRLSLFSACNIEKLVKGLGMRLLYGIASVKKRCLGQNRQINDRQYFQLYSYCRNDNLSCFLLHVHATDQRKGCSN